MGQPGRNGVLERVVAAAVALTLATAVAGLIRHDHRATTRVTVATAAGRSGVASSADVPTPSTTAVGLLAPTAVIPTQTVVTSPPSTSTTTAALPAPTTTTTAPRPTTTTTNGRTAALAPTRGGANTQAYASGTGCQGPDWGVSIAIFEPSGQEVDGSGSASQPDGSWRVPFYYPVAGRPTGRYKVVATCVNADTNQNQFVYAPLYFTFTG